MSACGLLLAPIAFSAAIVLIVKEYLWFLAAFDASALLGMVYLLFSRNLSYGFRAGSTLVLIYVVGLAILTNALMLSASILRIYGIQQTSMGSTVEDFKVCSWM